MKIGRLSLPPIIQHQAKTIEYLPFWKLQSKTQNWYEATGMTDKTHNSGATSLCPEGWRLPTIKELELIYNQNDRLSEEFRLTPTAMYWSSTTSDKNEDFAHIFEVSIDEDRQANKHKTDAGENYKVRCVRDI